MQEAIRDALVALVHADFTAAFAGVPLVHDNQPFDWNSLPERFVRYEIKFGAGRQIGMSVAPKARMFGFVYVTAYAREGTGAKWAAQVKDWFADHVGFAILSGSGPRITVQAPDPTGGDTVKGFYIERIKFEWYANPA